MSIFYEIEFAKYILPYLQNSNIEKTDWENRIGCIEIEASASVSRMGGSPTPEELLKAADEIARGAKFTAELQNMKLSYERTF